MDTLYDRLKSPDAALVVRLVPQEPSLGTMRGEANLILPEISSILFIICDISYQSNSGFNCDPGCSFWIYKTNKGRDKSLAFFLSFLRMVFNQLIIS